MAEYLDYSGLTTYDALIKNKINAGDQANSTAIGSLSATTNSIDNKVDQNYYEFNTSYVNTTTDIQKLSGSTNVINTAIRDLATDMQNADQSILNTMVASANTITDIKASADTISAVTNDLDDRVTSLEGALAGQIADLSPSAYTVDDKPISGHTGALVTSAGIFNAISTATENVAYISADVSGITLTRDFDVQADTVWNKPQTLTPNQKKQARANIGLGAEGNIDLFPTSGSTNMVFSDGIYGAISAATALSLSVYDVSANHRNSNNSNTFSLSEAIALVPEAYHRGGIKLTFISDTTGRYVEWLNTASGWTTDEALWQGVDNEPIAGSENLVKSGGVKKVLDDIVRTVDGTIYVKYEQGGLVDGKIPQTTVLSRVRTASFIDTEGKNLKVYIPVGILLYEVYAYSSADEDDFVIYRTVNKAIEYDFNVDVYARYIKLVFKKPDDSNISPADVEGVIIKNLDNLNARVKALEDVTIDGTPSPSSPNPVSSGGVYTALEGKVNVVAGKQLSTNDFTNEDKEELDSVPATYLKKKKEYSEISVDITESFWINIDDTTSAEATGRQYCGIPVTAGDKYKVSCYNHNSSFPGCRVVKQNNINEFYIRESTAGSYVDVEITINNSGTMYLNGLEGRQTIVVRKYVSQGDEDFYEEIATVEGKVAEIEDKELRSAKYYAKHVGDKEIEIYFKGYDVGKDLCLKIKSSINVNNILNFYSWEKIANNTGIVATNWRGGVSTDITGTQSDLVSAWFVRAVNNGDGDLVLGPNEFHPTGGWHGYDSATQPGEGVTPTGRTVWYKVIADDNEVASGNGAYCKKVVVQWCNRVQACNTEKADGTGREVIEEVITVLFNEGMKVKVSVEAKALEAVVVQHHYGINTYNATSLNGDVFFVGDNITPIGKDETGVTSTDKTSCNEIMFRGAYDTFVLHIDEHSCGNWKYCTNDTANARYGIPARKAYFRCIDTPDDAPVAFAQGGLVYVKGYYNCYPTKFMT